MPDTPVDISTAPVAEPDSGPTDFQVWGQEGAAVDAPVRQFPVGSFAVQSQIVTLQGQIDALDNTAASQAALIADLTTQIGVLEAIITNGGIAPTPVNLTAPSISDPAIGVTTIATPGTYEGTPTISGQWFLDGVAIPGATTTSYTPASGSGSSLKYVESATFGGTATVTESAPKVIGAPQTAPSFSTAPTVTPSSGFASSAFTANYVLAGNPAPSATFRWFIDDVEVAGETGATIIPDALGAPVTADLKVEVTATSAYGSPAVAESPNVTVKGPPTAANGLPDVVHDGSLGALDIATAFDFAGLELTFELVSGPASLSINPATGVLTSTGEEVASGTPVVVQAENGAGTVQSGFSLTVTAPSITLSAAVFDEGPDPDTISWTATAVPNGSWFRYLLNTTPTSDGPTIAAGGGVLSGSMDATPPNEVGQIDTTAVAPGSYYLHAVIQSPEDTTFSNVVSLSINITAAATWSVTAVAGDGEIVVTENNTPPTLTATPGDGQIVVTWAGGQTLDLHYEDDAAPGTWIEILGATSPHTITIANGTTLNIHGSTPEVSATAGAASFTPVWSDFAGPRALSRGADLSNPPASGEVTEFSYAVAFELNADRMSTTRMILSAQGSQPSVLALTIGSTNKINVKFEDSLETGTYQNTGPNALSAGIKYLWIGSVNYTTGLLNHQVWNLDNNTLHEEESLSIPALTSLIHRVDASTSDWIIGSSTDDGVGQPFALSRLALVELWWDVDILPMAAGTVDHFKEAGGALKAPSVAATQFGTPIIAIADLVTGVNLGNGGDFTSNI